MIAMNEVDDGLAPPVIAGMSAGRRDASVEYKMAIRAIEQGLAGSKSAKAARYVCARIVGDAYARNRFGTRP